MLELVVAPAPDDPPEPDPLVDAAVADVLDRAAPVPDPEPPPEEAPAVRLPDAEPPPEEAPAVRLLDPEAAVEDAVPVAGNFTAPGVARLVPAAVCAAAGAASKTESSNAKCSGLTMKSRPLRQFLPTTQLC